MVAVKQPSGTPPLVLADGISTADTLPAALNFNLREVK
jgi:hypothetical protein